MYDTGQHFCTEDLRFYEEKKSHTVNKKKITSMKMLISRNIFTEYRKAPHKGNHIKADTNFVLIWLILLTAHLVGLKVYLSTKEKK